MVERTISDNAALFVLEQWYGKPEGERVRFRSFCFQAGVFGDDFKYVNNIKRLADCYKEPMKCIQLHISALNTIEETEQEVEEETEADEETEVEEEEETEQEVDSDSQEEQEEEEEQEKEELQDDNIERLDVVIVRQGFTNMLLILLILVTSPYLAYNVIQLYNTYFRTYDVIYLLETPDVIYL